MNQPVATLNLKELIAQLQLTAKKGSGSYSSSSSSSYFCNARKEEII